MLFVTRNLTPGFLLLVERMATHYRILFYFSMKLESRNSVALADQKGYSAIICILNSDSSTDEVLYICSSYMCYVYSHLEIVVPFKWKCKCTKFSVHN